MDPMDGDRVRALEPRLHILVVEDNDDGRDLMVRLLQATGEHVIALAGNARDGLQCLRGATYDLLVTDVGLPDESGLEMLDRAKREGLLDETAVVVSGDTR